MSRSTQVSYGNRSILRSIPISSRLKSFLWKKFQWLVEHNGERFASDTFKELKEVVMAYTADTARLAHQQTYISKLKIRNLSVCKQILRYADTQPHDVINLLKIYTTFAEPIQTVEESSDELYNRLDALDYPDFKSLKDAWRRMNLDAVGVSYKCFRKVTSTWTRCIKRELDRTDKSVTWPTPSSYLKSNDPNGRCREDMFVFMQGLGYWDLADLPFFDNPDYLDIKRELGLASVVCEDLADEPMGVGHVHHIPKTGTVKRRPIADPNKWWQSLSEPYARALYKVLETHCSQTDCTFNQAKFVQEIQGRLNRGEYVGSVDLSAATDNLPLAWFPGNLGHLLGEDHPLWFSEQASLALARSWYLDDDGGAVSWKQGQPLGSKASFAILGITHNYILDLLCHGNQMTGRPYRILGDDILILDKDLRSLYIKFMQINGIPLSLHKSYDGRAGEFAGRWFVVNQPAKFTTDHRPIYKSNLFDYTRSTGTIIRWEYLPRAVRDFWSHGFKSVAQAKRVYYYVAQLEAGCPQVAENHSDFTIRFYQHLYSNEHKQAEDCVDRFWGMVDDQPFLYHGKANMATLNALKEWKRKKFRPFSTSSIRNAAIAASEEGAKSRL